MKISITKDFDVIARLNKPVHDLHCELYPNYFNKFNNNEMKEVFKKLMRNEAHYFLLLQENSEAVGYAWFEIKNYIDNPFKKGYTSVYIHQISIIEEKRNMGYGSSVMEHIYRIAINKGIDLIELDYWYKNSSAKAFYRKHGFLKYREFVYRKLTSNISP
ncbi:GNAT family N-acetyltransferase [Metabacillus litoralis]|uniref:GNAT family N-acetyltransferase n=1 Tax=Metabacillus litoralis TaxID=152268 RepID=UPI001CFC943C|nr:GNAT family N-acetyltransferase [Metabacillus litoralis]